MAISFYCCFFLFSLATSLQFPLQYHYNYTGRLISGIGERRHQFAAVGIKANLTFQVTSKLRGTAMLSNIFVGEYNDQYVCDFRHFDPIQYSPLKDSVAELEEPFEFTLNQDEGDPLTVPKSEEEWITNIRKSIIGMFLIEPLLMKFHYGKNGGVHSDNTNDSTSFQIEEDSIFGRCLFQYTVIKLQQDSNDLDYKIDKDKDIQSNTNVNSSSKVPFLKDDMWEITRSLDFQSCHGLLLAQRENVGGEYLASRSSVSRYLMRGILGEMRIETGRVEGSFMSNTFGQKTQGKLITFTNQDLQLIATKRIESELVLTKDLKTISTWRYEVASPYPEPVSNYKYSQPWINFYGNPDDKVQINELLMPEYFLTGKSISEKKSFVLKEKILVLLNKTLDLLLRLPPVPSSEEGPGNFSGGVVGFNLYTITKAMEGLTELDMEYLTHDIFRSSDRNSHIVQSLFVDACVASGGTIAINQVLKLLNQSDYNISDFKAATLVMSIGHSLASPAILPIAYRYLRSLSVKTRPLYSSAAFLNFANAARRICFDSKTYNTSVPQQLYGASKCDSEAIKLQYFTLFKDKLEEEADQPWEKAIYLHAIANLGIPETFATIKSYVLDDESPSIFLRACAIFALSSDYHDESVRNQVFELLNIIMRDPSEHPCLRQLSFSVMVSWKPDTQWWHWVASGTWYEPPNPLTALIYSTIRSLAKMNNPDYEEQVEIARIVLPLARSFYHPLTYPFKEYLGTYLPKERIKTFMELMFVNNPNDASLNDIFYKISASFGDQDLDFLQINLITVGLKSGVDKLLNFLLENVQEKQKSEEKLPKTSTITEGFLQNMKNHFELYSTKEEDEVAGVALNLFKNFRHFITINQEIINNTLGAGGEQLIGLMMQGLELNLYKYIVPVHNEYYLPTEIGIPLIHSDITSALIFGKGYASICVEDKDVNVTIYDIIKSKEVSLLYHLNGRLMSKVASKHTVLIPWNETFVESGVDHTKVLNFPIRGEFSYKCLNDSQSFDYKFVPLYEEEKQTLIYGHNIPYTANDQLILASNVVDATPILPIAIAKNQRPLIEGKYNLTNDFTGLSLYLKWSSDRSFAFTEPYVILDFIRSPEKAWTLLLPPTVTFWKAALVFDPINSETKMADFKWVYKNLLPTLDDSDISNNFVSRKNNSSEEILDSAELAKTQSGNRQISSVTFTSTLIGEDLQRFWNISIALQPPVPQGSYQKYGLQVTMILNHLDDSPTSINLKTKFLVPNLPDPKTLLQKLMENNVISSGDFLLKNGNQNVATFSTKLSISEERRMNWINEMDLSCKMDSSDTFDGLPTSLTYDRFEGNVKYKHIGTKMLRKIGLGIDWCLKRLLFQHFDTIYSENHLQSNIEISGQRGLSSNGWIIVSREPHKDTVFNDIIIPSYMTQIIPYNGFPANFPDLSVNSTYFAEPEDKQCIVHPNKVKSFYRVKSSLELNPCWTLLVAHPKWMLFTRWKAKRMEIRYADPEVMVTLPEDETYSINGETSERGDFRKNKLSGRISVLRDKTGYTLLIFRKLKVKVESSRVIVILVRGSSGHLQGLCSASGRSRMTGKNKCETKNPKLLTAFWTSTVDCSSQKLLALKKQLHSIDESCKQEF